MPVLFHKAPALLNTLSAVLEILYSTLLYLNLIVEKGTEVFITIVKEAEEEVTRQ